MAEAPTIVPLHSAGEIAARIDALAVEIAATAPRDLLVVVVLKGSFVFAADLLRALERAGLSPTVDFLTLASYGTGTRSTGTVTLARDLAEDVAGRHVLLVDDILDSGRTLLFARELLLGRGAASVRSCLLLAKEGRREVAIEADHVGFTIGDLFVVGYGLDLAHRFRGLPYIGVVTATARADR
ncbi:MAG: hypoxanthine phosphoribosyltransferase [Alphaproteobacteria bacterium]|nr:hypoxanthine phosphoribosyltransferase [Alphaproteobacteria bacterium]